MRHVLVACVFLLFGFAGAAHAASVYVQYASPTHYPDTVILDPLFATATDSGIFVEADLSGSASGATFKGFAFHDGSNAIASVAYSGIIDLTLTNAGAAPVAFGGATFPFVAFVTANFAGTVGGLDGGIGNQLSALLQVDDPSCGCARIAQVAYSYGESWSNGLLAGTSLSVEPIGANGGTASISAATRSTLVATLWMPVILLDPGASAVVHFNLLPVAIANNAGFNATTDASHSARLRLFVPAGSSITTDAGPLPWITVPEPSLVAMLGAGALAIACLGSRVRTARAAAGDKASSFRPSRRPQPRSADTRR